MVGNSLANKTDSFDLAKPNDVIGFSNKLKDLIVEKRLYTNIKGKNYPLVEAWQIAGALCGIYPEVKSLDDLSDSDTIKYRAEVVLKDANSNIVGAGIAICTNKEQGKQRFEEYAVASMAQTRAVGKAFRIKLGWLVKLAGYEATPAEEMDAVAAEVVEEDQKTAKTVNFREVREKLTEIDNLDELNNYWKSLNLTEAQAEILKDDFSRKKTKLKLLKLAKEKE